MKRYPQPLHETGFVPQLDLCAVGICALCLIHCIGLPLITILLPVAGLLSGDELVHRLLILLGAPVSIWLIYKASITKRHLSFIIMASTGLGLLVIAAFVELVSEFEAPLTVLGASVLGFSHLQRWLRSRRSGSQTQIS